MQALRKVTREEPGLAQGMEEEDGEKAIRRGWVRWLGVGTGSLALVLVALWTQRAPIAENFIGRELNRRGVQANYELSEIGLRTQRIENIVLGDPADPDLTAQWVEVDIAFAGLTPQVAAVRAGGVRMRASMREGVLRLGEIDKFRDPESTAPFSLPDILLSLRDARLRLDTDAGPVGMRIDGSGNLNSGFRGKLAAVMPRARLAGCGMTDATAWLDIAMSGGAPRFTGPVRGGAFGCRSAATAIARPVAQVDLRLGKALDRWTGTVRLTGDALRSNGLVMARPDGRVTFDGTAQGTSGRIKVGAQALAGFGGLAERADFSGAWRFAGSDASLQGRLSAQNVRLTGRDPLAAMRQSTVGTPIAPLAERLSIALRRAGDGNALQSDVAFAQKGAGGSLVLSGTQLAAQSGARVRVAPDGQLSLSWPGKAGAVDWALDGAITTEGGGLPRAALRLARRAGGGLGGQLFVDPYAAGDARLALEPVRFSAEQNGATRFSTALRLDGPLPDGVLRGLSVPVEGQIAANGAIAVNRRCVPVTLAEARYGTFALGQTRQTLCPLPGEALFATGPGGVRGGAEIRGLALAGRNGDSPMRLSADTARASLGQGGFTLSNMVLAIGPEDAPVRLTAATLDGRMSPRGLGGTVAGAGGVIGTVPLVVGDATGDWRFADGALGFKAAMTVRDAQAPSRFNPLRVPDFALTMKDGRIAATGTLRVPGKDALVARADIAHDLGSARGRADLAVPGLTFGPGLQPDALTLLTRGVIENVRGTVTGEGHIRWTGSDVTSDGVFRTDNTSLAAAFGPADGLSGEIRFTDLLGMVSAPGQEIRIRSVNPGVEVHDGLVRYRLEANQKVRVEGGGWPFSGGQLVLLPTTMDFGADVDRYLTFRVIGVDAGAFVQAMELDNVSATGTFDGIMPLIFNAQGGRVSGGVLVARQQGMPPLIMPEGVLPTIPCDPALQSGTLSYVGPVSNEQIGMMGKMAFDALKDLQYKCLTILMDGALDGEMVTNVVFNGVNRGKLGDAPGGIARNFVGLPFIFNVRISAPFRGLLGTAQSFINPSDLVQTEIGKQAQDRMRQGVAVQPAESETMRDREPR